MEMQMKIENPNIDVLKSFTNVNPIGYLPNVLKNQFHNNICNLIVSCICRN
jgi:hypothetical protein